MVFHLAAPCIQDPLSRAWKPGGTLTVRVRYRGPFRLPAVRVSGVLVGPSQERLGGGTGGALRLSSNSSGRDAAAGASGGSSNPGGGAVSPRSTAFWVSSRKVAHSAVEMWNTVCASAERAVEQQSARWSQSLQTLQRVGSRLLRSMSHDSVQAAAGGDGSDGLGGDEGSAAGGASDGRAAGGANPQMHAYDEAAATAAIMAAAAEAAAAAVAAAAAEVASPEALQAQEALLQRQLEQLGQLQASLSQFVTTASKREVNLACMLADLSNIAYDVQQILDGSLLEARHGLRLIACSHPAHASGAAPQGPGCALPWEAAAAAAFAAEQAAYEREVQERWAAAEAWETEEAAAVAAVMSAPVVWDGGAVPMPTAGAASDFGEGSTLLPMSPRAPVVVSAMTLLPEGEGEGERAAAAALCAGNSQRSPRSAPASPRRRRASAATPRAAAACLDAPTAGVAPPSPRRRRAAQQQQPAAGTSAPSTPKQSAAPSSPAAAAKAAAHPADWFVCDAPGDAATGAAATRYIVIQGSITVDHWRINLTFDPVPFGDEATGVKVHRGVYAAALSMYDSIAPLVKEHLACAGPGAKVAFAGHSLGGSLATVLTLLMVYRGDLPADALASVHTFGAPAVFCESSAHHRCSDACCSCGAVAAAAAASGGAGPHLGALLPSLGLGPHAITNVIMHRDIVPRAFVCDYTPVAEVLKSWWPSFKGHTGLAACKHHKILYHFVGDVEVLQPRLGSGIALQDEGHFMLPAEPALYKLTEPSCPLPASDIATDGHAHGPSAPRGALSLSDAILAFMNSPHPLQTLSEVRAYGPAGSISRFHNPQNYKDALAALLM